MEHARSHSWPAVFGWGLTLSGASLAFFGCLGLFLPDPALTTLASISFASLMAFAIACANVAADVAVRALRRADGVAWDAFVLAALTCVGFAVAANIGVHLGWELLALRVAPGVTLPEKTQVDLAFYVLCAGKPLCSALIAYLKVFSEQDAVTHKARRDAHHLAVLKAQAPQETVSAVADAARAARLEAAGVPDIAPGGAARHSASERPTEAELIAAAQALLRRGLTPSNRLLASELNLPRSRIERGPQTWRTLITAPAQASLLAAAI